MMGFLEHILEKYNEALEELMGAQRYATEACHAGSAEERTRYIEMSRDELRHADNIAQMADMVAAGSNDESTKTAWHALRMHTDDWGDRIREKLDRAAKK